MKIYTLDRIPLYLALLIAFTAYSTIAASKSNSCIECHQDIHPEIVSAFSNDAHNLVGLSCVDCHGGNASISDETSMDKKFGFVGVPTPENQPQFCGKCHSNPAFMRTYNPSLPTDQVDKFWTSKHGERLKKNDRKAATCSSCHLSHGIQSGSLPTSTVYPRNVPSTCANCHANADYMAEYGIPVTQFEQYTDSSNVHGYALFNKYDNSAPACNDCHGNHGAAPPGFETVAQVCHQCHTRNGDLFRNSVHKDAFDSMELSECAFCHQKSPDLDFPHKFIHTIVKPTPNLAGTGVNSVCIQCHSDGDEGWKTAEMIADLSGTFISRFSHAEEMIERAEMRGLEVSDAKWILDSDVKRSIMELRTVVHAFDPELLQQTYDQADSVLSIALVAGAEAEKEYGSRKNYMIVITLLILVMGIALIFKIRQMER